MNKLMMAVGAVALAGMMSGCVTGGTAGEDKVAVWQKERAPVEYQMTFKLTSVCAEVSELLKLPAALYPAVAHQVDLYAEIDRSRRTYIAFVNDVKAKEEGGMSRADAIAEVTKEVKNQADGEQLMADVKKYLDCQKSRLPQLVADLAKATADAAKAAAVLADIQKHSQDIIARFQAEVSKDPFGLASDMSCLKDDIGVITAQAQDMVNGIGLLIEMIKADKDAAEMQADYPVEG